MILNDSESVSPITTTPPNEEVTALYDTHISTPTIPPNLCRIGRIIRENNAALFGKASCQYNNYNRHRNDIDPEYGLGEECQWRRTREEHSYHVKKKTFLAKAQDLTRSYRCGATAVP